MKNILMLTAAILLSAPIAFGGDNNKQAKANKISWMNMSPETRTQMADMHQKTADCLKSSKSVAECRDTMMANCPMMKNGKCSMMGMMGYGHHHDDDHESMHK